MFTVRKPSQQDAVGFRRRILRQHVVDEDEGPQRVLRDLRDVEDIEVAGDELASGEEIIQGSDLRLLELSLGPGDLLRVVLVDAQADQGETSISARSAARGRTCPLAGSSPFQPGGTSRKLPHKGPPERLLM
jgi:hypothetical protein